MSLGYTKELSTTAFTCRSSKIRNKSSYLTVSKFITSSTGRSLNQSFTQGNMTSKLSLTSDQLHQISSDLQMQQQQVKQTKLFCQSVNSRLSSLLQDKEMKIKNISKQLIQRCQFIVQKQSMRTKKLQKQCDELQQNQRKTKQKFLKMKTRVENLQNTMGYYCANEKYIS